MSSCTSPKLFYSIILSSMTPFNERFNIYLWNENFKTITIKTQDMEVIVVLCTYYFHVQDIFSILIDSSASNKVLLTPKY